MGVAEHLGTPLGINNTQYYVGQFALGRVAQIGFVDSADWHPSSAASQHYLRELLMIHFFFVAYCASAKVRSDLECGQAIECLNMEE